MAFPDDSWDPDAPADGDGLFGLPHTPDEAAVVVLPVPWDATCSYRRGTAGAPTAVLEASAQIDLFDLETGAPWRAGVAMERIDPHLVQLNGRAAALAESLRQGGTPAERAELSRQIDAMGEQVHAGVAEWTTEVLRSGRVPAVLGGEHSVAYGAVAVAALHRPGLGLLHIDAHADLRPAYEGLTWSHASVIHNLLERVPTLGPISQVGLRDLGHAERERIRTEPRLHATFDPDIAWKLARGVPWVDVVRDVLAALPEEVWVTLDVDGLDPSLCPGTGTPVPGGLSWRQLSVLLRSLVASGRRIVGFDLCEVGSGPWDADVGARLLYKLAGWALTSNHVETAP